VLALGGGGARGIAHIGVIRVLEKSDIPIHAIVGTSMGAVIGGLYAQIGDSFVLENKIRALLQTALFKAPQQQTEGSRGSWLQQLSTHLCKQMENCDDARLKRTQLNQSFTEELQKLFPEDLFEQSSIPFAAVASDLCSGREVILSRGRIVDAVLASSAMPGFFEPIVMGNYLLSDGAATSAVPIRAARHFAPLKPVVAVDVSSQLPPQVDRTNALSFVLRATAVTGACYHDELIKEADILIQPEVKQFSWSDFDNIDHYILQGERAAKKAIKKMLFVADSRY